jgi:2-hydroxychromene-2-carboxylate isomerase
MNDAAIDDIPEAALATVDHVLGDVHAKLTMLEYGDYECPACIQAEPLMQHLVKVHRGRLRLVFRHFPLMDVHPNAELVAEAAEAAAAQGRFWPMHHLLFAQVHHLAPSALAGYAQSLGLDMNRFNAEMGDRIYTQRVQEHRCAGERSGLRATPAMFLNGRAVDVSFGFEKLDEAAHQRDLRGLAVVHHVEQRHDRVQRKVGVREVGAGLGDDLPQGKIDQIQVRYPALELAVGQRRQQSIRRHADLSASK